MARYLLKRVFQAILVMLIISIGVFLLVSFLPGDPVYAILGEGISQETYDIAYHELGLDKPIFRKFCNYGHFTHADAPWEQMNMTEVLESACRAKETGVSAR